MAVVRAEDAASKTHHPATAVLVIEVSGDSLRFDRRTKAALYALTGIPEYWIVNLEDATIEVRRDPDAAAGAYRETRIVRSGETLTPTALPGVSIDVSGLFQ